VGVDYSSDVELVKKILIDSVINHSKISPLPEPFVRFENFGDSSLDFSVFFWSHEIFPIENIKSEIRFTINKKFRENGVTIPFPQRVVHVNKTE
jgi:small-conductance mechanosensitive channel